MDLDEKIQIIYSPGTFGKLLRWLLDRFSPSCRFKQINSPWDKDYRVHNKEEENLYNKRFLRGHQIDGLADHLGGAPDSEAEKIVIGFNKDELVFVERCAFYRSPGNEIEQTRYQKIISESNVELLKLFNINQDVSSKIVAKELSKIQFHDYDNNFWWNTMFKFINDPKNFIFPIEALWNKSLFIEQLEKINNRFQLNLEIDENIIDNITQKISQMYVIKTKNRADEIYEAIKNKQNIDCHELDILEQAWIEMLLEKQNQSVIFPYGTNWFKNTNEINEFIKTYPSYLKHINPLLPWHNNFKNPFYLKFK